MTAQGHTRSRTQPRQLFVVGGAEGAPRKPFSDARAARRYVQGSQNYPTVVAVGVWSGTIESDPRQAVEILHARLTGSEGACRAVSESVIIGLLEGIGASWLKIAASDQVVSVEVAMIPDPLGQEFTVNLSELRDVTTAAVTAVFRDEPGCVPVRFLELLAERLEMNSLRRLLSAQSAHAIAAHAALRAEDVVSPALVEGLLEHRVRLRAIIAAQSHGSGTGRMAAELHSAVVDTDSLTQFVLSRQTMDLNSAAERESNERQARELRDRRRQERLERIAFALLIPGLWLGYWGTTAAPIAHGVGGNAVVVGVTILIALAAWWLPGVLNREDKL